MIPFALSMSKGLPRPARLPTRPTPTVVPAPSRRSRAGGNLTFLYQQAQQTRPTPPSYRRKPVSRGAPGRATPSQPTIVEPRTPQHPFALSMSKGLPRPARLPTRPTPTVVPAPSRRSRAGGNLTFLYQQAQQTRPTPPSYRRKPVSRGAPGRATPSQPTIVEPRTPQHPFALSLSKGLPRPAALTDPPNPTVVPAPIPSFPRRREGEFTFLNKHPQLTHPTPPSFPLSREPRAGARRGGVSVPRHFRHP